MPDIREYILEDGRSPFAVWFHKLEARAAAKVAVAKIKLVGGQFGNLKAVGEGVSEYRIDYGPGYRVYLGRDGAELVILLGGGDKTSQSEDIAEAKRLWKEYKHRKAMEKKAAAAGTASPVKGKRDKR
ncbi:MAG: type II toxin-antitoxin system RelE/ParE family toxin [Magnetospirillum sp.]|nr:type II toxin-antitoxin system RelE/ParE family toxin [Magnetospirillum sp.]